jgi:uncharacterized protein YggU (UPF0235/DUF167 family)
MARNTHGLRKGGGRPKGIPNKTTTAVRELAQSLVNDDAYLAKLKAQLRAGKANPAVVTMLWAYAFGKPKETVEITGENGGPISVIRRVIVDPDESE